LHQAIVFHREVIRALVILGASRRVQRKAKLSVKGVKERLRGWPLVLVSPDCQ
jgi:hypothetical protein